MSASLHEVQVLADQILELLDARIPSGQLVVHYHEGHVVRVEANQVFRPRRQVPFLKELDNHKGNGAP